jgi:hypothetical protein
MEISPCLSCSRRNETKNNPVCRDCDKRIEYVQMLEMELSYTSSYGDFQQTSHRIPLFSSDLAPTPRRDSF